MNNGPILIIIISYNINQILQGINQEKDEETKNKTIERENKITNPFEPNQYTNPDFYIPTNNLLEEYNKEKNNQTSQLGKELDYFLYNRNPNLTE